MTSNQIAIAALMEQGLNKASVARELGLTRGYVTQVTQKSSKLNLAKKKNVKSAINTIVSLSKGEPVGTIETVRDSTALTAASLIYDKYDPPVTRIQQDVRTQSINLTPETINAMSDFLRLKADIDNDNRHILIDNTDIDNQSNNINDIKEIDVIK